VHNREDDVAGFLGVLMTPKDDGMMELTQTGLINWIITAMELNDANLAKIPAEYCTLGNEESGMDSQEKWIHRRVLRMMMYFLCHT
jgi:hypothetical protein